MRCESEAAFVWIHGLERGDFADLKNEPYVKDLPLTKTVYPEVLLATSMNAMPLAADRGGPVRLVVPGWYGTNSVKWVGALTLSDRRAPGPYTTRFYNDPSPGGPLPVWGIAPESILVSPSPDQPPQADEVFPIRGWAWAESGVAKVEVSADAGRTWIPATLEARHEFSWQQFSLPWTFESGQHDISCRCFDSNGTGQPESGSRNAVHTIVINVLASR